jgi:ribosomal small subunit protein bTHX
MGKGDKKSKRGKIFAGSFGVRRRKKDKPKKVEVIVKEVKTVKAKKKTNE